MDDYEKNLGVEETPDLNGVYEDNDEEYEHDIKYEDPKYAYDTTCEKMDE